MSSRSVTELGPPIMAGGAVGLGGDDPDDLELGVERARELDGRGDGGVGLVGAVVGDADPADRLVGARAVAVRDDRDGARRAVQQPLAGAPRGDAAQPAGVRGADDDDLGVLGLGEVVEGMRGRGVGRDPDAAGGPRRSPRAGRACRGRSARRRRRGPRGRTRWTRGSARRCRGRRRPRRRARSRRPPDGVRRRSRPRSAPRRRRRSGWCSWWVLRSLGERRGGEVRLGRPTVRPARRAPSGRHAPRVRVSRS